MYTCDVSVLLLRLDGLSRFVMMFLHNVHVMAYELPPLIITTGSTEARATDRLKS
jgi:hypothetical protein